MLYLQEGRPHRRRSLSQVSFEFSFFCSFVFLRRVFSMPSMPKDHFWPVCSEQRWRIFLQRMRRQTSECACRRLFMRQMSQGAPGTHCARSGQGILRWLLCLLQMLFFLQRRRLCRRQRQTNMRELRMRKKEKLKKENFIGFLSRESTFLGCFLLVSNVLCSMF